MLKKANIIILVFIFCFIFSSCGNDEPGFHTVETEIVNGCYIEKLDNNMQSMYYYPKGDKTNERIYIVDEWKNIIKYASDEKYIVAFHCIYEDIDTSKDMFVIFNLKEEKERDFDTQDDFIEYCENEKINLSDWKSVNGIGCEKIDLGNDWCVYDFDYPFNDQILKGSKVVYEGYVSDIEYKENDFVEYIFAVPYGAEKEIPSSNENLNVNENIIGEYKFTSFGKTEVLYYEKLILNTVTGDVTVVSE